LQVGGLEPPTVWAGTRTGVGDAGFSGESMRWMCEFCARWNHGACVISHRAHSDVAVVPLSM
jgi:hypothetical protein